MQGNEQLKSLKDAVNILEAFKSEAEFGAQLSTAEHKRLLRLLRLRMDEQITEEQMWATVGGE